jgi:hypothetical protein
MGEGDRWYPVFNGHCMKCGQLVAGGFGHTVAECEAGSNGARVTELEAERDALRGQVAMLQDVLQASAKENENWRTTHTSLCDQVALRDDKLADCQRDRTRMIIENRDNTKALMERVRQLEEERDKEARIAEDWFQRHNEMQTERDALRGQVVVLRAALENYLPCDICRGTGEHWFQCGSLGLQMDECVFCKGTGKTPSVAAALASTGDRAG